ncbi:MAG: hydroxysqualene dehydroxylase HpnE, partial [Acidimicrobiales bacterium]
LERLGTADLAPLAGPLSIPVLRPRPARANAEPELAWIRRSATNLPAPLHLAASLLSYRHLGLSARARLLGPALALRRASLGDAALDTESFGEFLRRHGQSEQAIEGLWDLIVLPTTNLHASEVSLALAAKVFKTGLLTSAKAADIGWSRVPLTELHVLPAARLIASLGGEVRQRSRVTRVSTSAGTGTLQVTGVETPAGPVEADAVVLAVPHDAAAGLLPPGSHPDPGKLAGLGSSPIVNVHVVFDRKVTGYGMAAAIGSPVQFVFDRTAASGARSGQVLAVSLSGADAEIGERPESLLARITTALRHLFPDARQASVLDGVVTREQHATFRGVPGTAPLRTGPATSIPNLAVAGAWTATGWPATMEGAVRSGRSAARVALEATGHIPAKNATREEVVA